MSTANTPSLDSQKRSPQSPEGDNGIKRPVQSPEGDAAFQRAAPPKGKPAKTRRRLLPLAIVACALAVGGAGAWYWWQQQLSALPAGIANANGRLESEQVEIATKYSGRIATVLAQEGQMVDAGEVVARHGVVVTAVSPPAFTQALYMARRKGTVSLVGLPPGEFATPIFDVVLKRITLRGSIVGGRQDLSDALQFAAEGKVRATTHLRTLTDINDVFADLRAGKVDGRVVITM
jgi:D-arabinose 1-dehydrogenase-like Zn-dependent alcohol dehydrogenase